MKAQADKPSQKIKSIELYPLPEGWKWITVNDAGANQKNAIVDGPFGSNLKVSDYVEEGPVPVLITKNLEGNYDKARYITLEKFEELKRSAVYPGDILMAKIGSCGKTGIYPANKPPAMIPANLLKVTLNDQFELKYVYYYFNSSFFQKALRTITKATAQPAFGVTNFRRLPLPYVNRDQQKRIVAEIEKQFSRLDEAVANLKRVKANLKRYKAAVLKAAVEGRLVETEAERARREGRSFETGTQLLQRILETRRSQWKGKGKYKEPAAPDTSDLPELPEGWVWALLDSLIIDGPQNGIYLPKTMYGSGHPILRIDDYQQDWIRPVTELQRVRAKAEDIATYSLRSGDLVINRVNSPSHLGKVAIWAAGSEMPIFESNMMRAALSSAVVPLYIATYLRSVDGSTQLTKQAKWAVNQASINQQDVCGTPVPLPPHTEQIRIIEEVDRHLSLIRETMAQVDINLKRAERLRQTILKKAFVGNFQDTISISKVCLDVAITAES